MSLFGRDELIDQLQRSEAVLVVVSGDSGIGKSAVLYGSQERSTAVAPEPSTLPWSAGALEWSLMESLARATLIVEPEPDKIASMLERLERGAEAALKEYGKELVSAMVSQLATAIFRVDPDLKKVLKGIVDKARKNAGQTLAEQIMAKTVRPAAFVIADFAGQLVELAGNRPVQLAIDGGERMPENDVRLLLDLSEHLAEGLSIRVAINTGTLAGRTNCLLLTGKSYDLTVPPLDQPQVASWLEVAGLSSVNASEALRVTGGYPLYMEMLVTHLENGGRITDMPIHDRMAELTHEALSSLPDGYSVAARQLCVLNRPLEREAMASLVGIGAFEWGQFERRMKEARLFTQFDANTPWFHEQRRRVLLDDLTDPELLAANQLMLPALETQIIRQGRADLLVDYSNMHEQSALIGGADEATQGVLDLDRNGLAVAAALVELSTGATDQGLSADAVLLYAREVFGASGTLIDVLSSLRDSKLIAMAANDHAAVVIPAFTRDTLLLMMGRAAEALGRTPQPNLATWVFDSAIRPMLGAFADAAIGIGTPSVAELAKKLEDQQRMTGQFPSRYGNRLPPGLLVHGRYGTTPIYAAIRANDASNVTADADTLRNGDFPALDLPIVIERVTVSPSKIVRSRRFSDACNYLGITEKTETSMDWADAIGEYVSALNVFQKLCSPEEATALRLTKAHSRYFEANDSNLILIKVVGDEPHASEVPGLLADAQLRDPFQFFHLAERIGLRPNESIFGIERSFGKTPQLAPILDAAQGVEMNAGQFNDHQPVEIIAADEASIANAILDYEDGIRTTATELASKLDFIEPITHSPRATRVLVELPVGSGFPDSIPIVSYARYDDDTDSCLVHIVDRSEDPNGLHGWDLLADVYGLPSPTEDHEHRIGNWHQGWAESVLAALLGYRDTDIRLAYKVTLSTTP